MTLLVLPIEFAILKLSPQSTIPKWTAAGDFYSVSKTPDELSIVCPALNVPKNVKAEKNWMCVKVDGVIDFAQVGTLSSLTQPLAKAEISIFAISTFNTDYLFVKRDKLEQTIEALVKAGFEIKYEKVVHKIDVH